MPELSSDDKKPHYIDVDKLGGETASTSGNRHPVTVYRPGDGQK